jgi:glycosyltransferase involved in cell wall biosynthesis
MSSKLEITYFFRKPQPQYFSIEKVFEEVLQHLPTHIVPRIYKLKTGTNGWWGRVKALIEVRKHKGVINHITGDITFIAMALPRKGLVVTYHDLESLTQYRGWRFKLLKFLWVTIPVRRAQVVTAISQHTKEQLIQWTNCSPYKIMVIPNPLPEELKYQPKELDETHPSILVMGTKANKNVEGVFEAVYQLKSLRGEELMSEDRSPEFVEEHRALHTRHHYQLIVVGEMSAEQIALAEKYRLDIDNLVQVPYEQILDAYQRCDMLCFPSFYEGFGLPIIEAQAIGRPVITSNFGAMKEVAGQGAILVNPKQVKEIAKAVLKLTEDQILYQMMIEKGLKNVQRFKGQTIAGGYSKVYRALRRGER